MQCASIMDVQPHYRQPEPNFQIINANYSERLNVMKLWKLSAELKQLVTAASDQFIETIDTLKDW